MNYAETNAIDTPLTIFLEDTGKAFVKGLGSHLNKTGRFVANLLLLITILVFSFEARSDVREIDVVATSVRVKGFECAKPSRIQRDEARSKPDRPVWIIWCDDEKNIYSVTYVGDDRTSVKRLRK